MGLVTVSDYFVVDSGEVVLTIDCPTGTLPTGGGYSIAPVPGITATASYPIVGDLVTPGWRVDFNNTNASQLTATVYAVCAETSSGS